MTLFVKIISTPLIIILSLFIGLLAGIALLVYKPFEWLVNGLIYIWGD